MIRRQRFVAILLALAVALAALQAGADDYDPPVSYYNGTAGLTGAALLSQLRTIVSDMTDVTYGDARYSAPYTDPDPNAAGNILLIYNRASVSDVWDNVNLPWNREHIWPQSRLGASASNNVANIASDQFNLRPADTDINNARGDDPFGLDASSGNYGPVGDYFYPGDADAGDVARSQFYMATRYSTLSLTDNDPPTGTQMGDLSSLIYYHFRDVPDAFERRRNHAIYGLPGATGPAISNPYMQSNRNPFVDHPEWVWSIFKTTNNNSQIAIDGATVNGDGSSTKNVDLGRVFVGGGVPGAQSVKLNKGGTDGTYYEVTTNGAATSTVTGKLNAFRTTMTDSKTFNVGLNTTTTSAGLKSGTVTVNNLDITGSAGSGHGAGDANDTINLSLTVLDHATPSFAGGSTVTTLMHDFGSVTMGSAAPTFNFDLFNRSTTPGYTADLDFDSVMGSGGAAALAALSTNLAVSAGSLSLDAGAYQQFTAMLNTSVVGSFSATYTLNLSDENLPGALNTMLTLSLAGQVTAALLAGDYNRDGVVDAADYVVWRRTYGTSVTPFDGADGDGSGTVGDEDYPVWMTHFGDTSGSTAGATTTLAAVPEPAGWVLALMGGLAWLAIYPIRVGPRAAA